MGAKFSNSSSLSLELLKKNTARVFTFWNGESKWKSSAAAPPADQNKEPDRPIRRINTKPSAVNKLMIQIQLLMYHGQGTEINRKNNLDLSGMLVNFCPFYFDYQNHVPIILVRRKTQSIMFPMTAPLNIPLSIPNDPMNSHLTKEETSSE